MPPQKSRLKNVNHIECRGNTPAAALAKLSVVLSLWRYRNTPTCPAKLMVKKKRVKSTVEHQMQSRHHAWISLPRTQIPQARLKSGKSVVESLGMICSLRIRISDSLYRKNLQMATKSCLKLPFQVSRSLLPSRLDDKQWAFYHPNRRCSSDA